MRADKNDPEVFIVGPPSSDTGARFSLPGKGDINEFLEYVEDMSLLFGCSKCKSMEVREVQISGLKYLSCVECGHTEMSPRAN
jgi:hypothetical protein